MSFHIDSGSSPHVRGTSWSPWARLAGPRFIPARAGNIGFNDLTLVAGSVHPRTCGEHTKNYALPYINAGSSPHVRGTFRGDRRDRGVERFIPARAGNMSAFP